MQRESSLLLLQENTELQNKVMEMGEKLTASEKLVLELQKELNLVVKDKVAFVSVLWLSLLKNSSKG